MEMNVKNFIQTLQMCSLQSIYEFSDWQEKKYFATHMKNMGISNPKSVIQPASTFL